MICFNMMNFFKGTSAKHPEWNPPELSAQTAKELPLLPAPPDMGYPEFVRYFQRRLEREIEFRRAAALRTGKNSRRFFLLFPAAALLLMCAFCLLLRAGCARLRENAENRALAAAENELDQLKTQTGDAQMRFRDLVFYFSDGTRNIPSDFVEPEIFQTIRADDAAALRSILAQGVSLRTTVDSDGRTALALAAELDHAECVRLLLDSAAPVNITDAAGLTPLARAARENALGSARLLLDAGADCGLADPRIPAALPALHIAADNGRRDMIQLMIEHGAKVGARAPDGRTALDLAFKNGDEATCNLLNRYGAGNE